MPDAIKNFAYSTIVTAPSPATSGTSLTVYSGQGALFPTPPFNVTVWPTATNPLASNAEIVRVTGIAGDVFTIVRAQEDTTARSIIVGDNIAETVTAKTITDITFPDVSEAEAEAGTGTSNRNWTPERVYQAIIALAPGGGGGSGTVSSVSVATANGVSGSVATPSTTPVITLTLGAITPSSVNGVPISGASTPTLVVTGSTAVSGTNTGDQTTVSGNAGSATQLQTARNINGVAFDGTANITVQVPVATGITGLGTGIATALAVNVGSAGAPVVLNGAGGTPSSLTLTNATGLPISTGVSGLGTGVATALAANSNATGGVVTVDGTATLTNKTLTAPTTTGVETLTGTRITTAAAMGALAIDVTKALNTKSISADSTFTFSATPSANQWFAMLVTNTDASNPHTLTIPSSFSVGRGGAITSVIIASLGKMLLTWQYDGSAYNLYGDPAATSGTGDYALTNGATLVAPVLGTPASGALTNCTADGTNLIGYRGAPQNSQSAAYTLVLGDAGKSVFHPASDANARTFTIPANASVAYPVGTIIEFINMSAQNVTIAITSDTLTLLPAGSTGSRTLAQYGRASAEKISSTAWVISGNSALT